MGEGEELRVPAVVNLVLPARNEMPAFVPLLSHKRCTHWLRIACTGVCAVARAIGDFPQSWLAERARCGTLATGDPARGMSGRRPGVRQPRGDVGLRTACERRQGANPWTQARSTSPSFPAAT